MTYLPATVIGMWFHLHLILDVYSRKIVGWEVHVTDDSVHAAHLVRRTALAEGIATMPTRPVLHGDNGATLKATTVLAMLYWLGVKPSYSGPSVSDENEVYGIYAFGAGWQQTPHFAITPAQIASITGVGIDADRRQRWPWPDARAPKGLTVYSAAAISTIVSPSANSCSAAAK